MKNSGESSQSILWQQKWKILRQFEPIKLIHCTQHTNNIGSTYRAVFKSIEIAAF